MAWAYSIEGLPGPAKAVLAYLAFRDGETCNPSIRTISKDTGYTRNAVKAAIKLLIQECLIETQARYANNARLSDVYALDYMHMRTGRAGQEPSTHVEGVGQEMTQGGSAGDPGVGQETATEHEEEHEEERDTSDTEVSDTSSTSGLRLVDTSDRAFRRDGVGPGEEGPRPFLGVAADVSGHGEALVQDEMLPDPWASVAVGETRKSWGF